MSPREREKNAGVVEDFSTLLSRRVIGQESAIREIVPHVLTFQAGLQPENRPAAIFLLLGPTGTGKTRTVEAIAEILHGNQECMLKIDCGEFQLTHEVAKLIGSPPGYTGHRETPPLLSQAKLNEVTSERCPFSIVLFDEIEKAAPSVHQILLGVLDKGVITLGDNTVVNLRNSVVFMTSNLGAAEMKKALQQGFGFSRATDCVPQQAALEKIAFRAVEKCFSPEFVNRLDAVITYGTLSQEALGDILEIQIGKLQQRIDNRFADSHCKLEVSDETKQFLIDRARCDEYGARELNRVIQKHLTQPLAGMITRGEIATISCVRVNVNSDESALCFSVESFREVASARRNVPLRIGFSFATANG